MKLKVISGGQTGADLAGLWVARCFGLETGGHAPKDFQTQAGNKLELAQVFGLVEHSQGYRQRTIENVRNGHVTLVFSRNLRSYGTVLTANSAAKLNKPLFIIEDTRTAHGFLDYFWGRGMVDNPAAYQSWYGAISYLVERTKSQLLSGLEYPGRDELTINLAGNASKDNNEAFNFAFVGFWKLLVEFYRQTGRYTEIAHLESITPLTMADFLKDDFSPERATELDTLITRLRRNADLAKALGGAQ